MPIPVKISETIGSYLFEWPALRLRASISRIAEDRHSRTTSAEIRFVSLAPASPEHIYLDRLNLLSAQRKGALAKQLAERVEIAAPWEDLIEFICTETLRRYREGDPIIQVGNLPVEKVVRYRLYPLMPEGSPTILYGEPGAFKSYFALLISLLVASGEPRLGLNPIQGNVLYLDYETSQDEVNERLVALGKGFGMTVPNIDYRFCALPLEADADYIQGVVTEREINLIVIDSIGLACGGSLTEGEPTIQIYRVLRRLRCSSLLIDHTGKTEKKLEKTPFGSTYKTIYARSAWEAKRVQDLGSDTLRIGLFHRKVNRGKLRLPLGFEAHFENTGDEDIDKIMMTRADVRDDHELSQYVPLKEQVAHCLSEQALTIPEIATRLDKSEANIHTYLKRLDKRVVKLKDGKWGLASNYGTQEIAF